MEFTLLWQALAGVGAAVLVARLQQRRGVISRATGLGDRIVGAAAAGLLVGRLTAMLIQRVNPLLHPGDILVVRGGVHTGAASLMALVTLAWGLRPEILRGLDAASAAVLAGLAGWHAGCVFRGACLGTVSGLPWAVPQPGSSITRHPVELYAAGLYTIAAGAALLFTRRWKPGVVFGLALATASAVRLVTQPMRPSIEGGPVGWYVAGIVAGLLATAIAPRLTGISDAETASSD